MVLLKLQTKPGWFWALAGALFLTACARRVPEPPAGGLPPIPDAARPEDNGVVRAPGAGNGEAYNGPHLSGLSVPPTPDRRLELQQVQNAAGLCLEQTNRSLLYQLFGTQAARMKEVVFVDTKPDPLSAGSALVRARGFILFYLRDNPTLWRFQSRADFTPRERRRTPSQTFFTVVVEPDSSELTNDPPVQTPGTWYFRGESPLPGLAFHLPESAWPEGGGGANARAPVLGVTVDAVAPTETAVPLADGFTGAASPLTLNPDTFSLCLQSNLRRDGQEPVLLAPGGARGEAIPDFSRFAPYLAPLRELDHSPETLGSRQGRAAHETAAWAAMEQIAQAIFHSYLAGEWDQQKADHWANFCELVQHSHLGERDYCHRLSYQTPRVIYRESRRRLERWAESAPTLSRLLERVPDDQALPRFSGAARIWGGGYFRGQDFIAANLLEIRPDRWWLFFIHELTHMGDSRLREAVGRYTPLLEACQSDCDGAALRELVGFGLDRGLLAEWRAWTVTLQIYREAVEGGLWPAIAEVDALLGEASSPEALARHLLDYFREEHRFSDPDSGLFASPAARKALREARARLAPGNPLPPWGTLGPVIGLP